MTISPPAALRGAQRPRLLHLPADIASTSGPEATELAASAGLVLDPWQSFSLDVGLAERSDGQWSAFEVGEVVSRQNGKGSILEARELAGLFLFGERLILHSAHEFKTASEAFLRVKALVDNTDDLRKKVKQIRTSHGDEGIELLNGARLRFVARSRGSGRGFSGDCVILDEAYHLGPAEMGALLPTLSARPNPQIWYASSAPMEQSTQLHAVRRRALAGTSPRLAYLEWSIDPELDAPDDPQSWAKANPSMGIRIPEEFIRAEMAALPPAEFARERLGVPDLEHGATVAVIQMVVWDAAADPASQWDGRPVGVADVSPNGATSLALCGKRSDGRAHVELVDNRPGTSWVAERRAELQARYNVSDWARDPRGLSVELPGEWTDVTAREMAEACPGFVTALQASAVRWRCADHLERILATAVSGAVKADRGDGAWTWSRRRSSGVDISPLVALTIGWHLASSKAPAGDPMLAVW